MNFRNCTICGKEYQYCSKCEKRASWKAFADSHECFQVYMILEELRESIINEKEATIKFSNIGITLDYDFSGYLTAVANKIKSVITNGTTVEVKTTKTK